MNWFVEHWEIKVIALMMAVTLYVFTGSLIRVDKSFTIELDAGQVVDLPSQMEVRGILPSEITVEINGPMRVLTELAVDDLRPRLVYDEKNVENGQLRVDVTARMLQLDPDLRLQFASPERVGVMIDRIVVADLPVSVAPSDFEIDVPGLVVRQVRLDRTQVGVSGPERLIDELREQGPLRVRTKRIADLDPAITEPVKREVVLELDLDRVSITDATPLKAEVTIAPAPAEMPINLPLHVIADPEFHRRYVVELHQPQVVVTVRGTRNKLDGIKPEEHFLAYVDLTGKPILDIPQTLPVKVLSPQWATVSPTQARVTVRLRASGDLPAQPLPRPPDPSDERPVQLPERRD